MILRFYIILLLGSVFHGLYGQNKSDGTPVKMLVYQHLDNDSVMKRFDVRFEQMDSLLENMCTVPNPPILYTGISLKTLDSLYKSKGENEIRAFKRKNGMELSGQVYQRLDNTLGFDEDDKYSRYSTKFQGEVGWNFFNSSFFQRKSEMQYLNLSNELQYIEHGKRLVSDVWRLLEDSVNIQYDRLIVSILRHRLLNVDILNMAYQYTLEQDKVGNGRLLEVMNDKMDIEYALLQTASMDSISSDILILPLVTIITVDTVRLFGYLEKNHPDICASYVKENMLAVRRRLTNYVQEMRFTPFLRASHYLREKSPYNTSSSSTNIDLGVRFTFPLYDDTSGKRKALRTEQILTVMDRHAFLDEAREHCQYLLDKLDGLNRTITAESLHLEQLKIFIDKRRAAYKNSPNGYNYIIRLEEYNGYLKSVERLCRLMLSRNLCLLEIQKTTGCMDMQEMINEKNVDVE